VHPDRVISNQGACPGDIIFLTKPLGTGIIATAIKAELADPAAVDEAVYWMSMLNRVGAEVMQQVGVNAATDVTGFGLVGHLFELAAASDIAVELNSDKISFIQGALEYARLGLIPGGAYTNRDYLADKVEYGEEIEVTRRDLLYAPETAGGLLVSVAQDKAEMFRSTLQSRKCTFYEIGTVLHKGFRPIKIVR